MTDTSIAVNPSLKPLPYDSIKDFEPVSLLATAPVILVAHPSLPAKTLQDFVALARQQPGKFTTPPAASAPSTHLGGELLKFVAGIDVAHVPYKGTGPAMNDLIGGHVACDVLRHLVGAAHMDSGALRALAVTGERAMPPRRRADLRGSRAAGRDRLDLLGSARAERHAEGDRRARERGVREGVREPEVVARIAQLGYLPIAGGPSDYAANIKSRSRSGRPVVKNANIKAE